MITPSSSDRIRTSINVMGDAFGAGIVAHLARDQLRGPAKRLNSVCVAVPHTKWGTGDGSVDELNDSVDKCGEGDTHEQQQQIPIELIEATNEQRA